LGNNGKDLMIFPEGGRYTDGTVHTFFKGFAIIAKRTNRPVVPVYLRNTGKACPPKSLWIHDIPVEVVVGPPFSYYENEDDDAFLNRVHEWFVQQQGR
jgi:1-acyl-sn-glycerol-3-phosphate acyltransferase